MQPTWHKIVTDVLSLPTAPFAEHAVIDYVREFCGRRSTLRLTEDRAGNLLIRYRRGSKPVAHPICLAAHLDHPGFAAERMIGPRTVLARWRGGVRGAFFPKAKVRFFVDGRWVRGVISGIQTKGRGTDAAVRTARITVNREIPKGAIGMWDLPDPRVSSRHIRARACDDLAGVAGMLCALDYLCRRKPTGDGYFLFTRAEEVGFVGAMAACRQNTVPKKCTVVAVETSSELPNARIGDGPVLRVGDKSTVYTPAATAFCRKVADAIAKRDKSFAYQRRLMDGGTCEAAAYCDFGYQATGICLSLGNYHNMNVAAKRIDSEYVGTRDFENLVKWFVALVRSGGEYAEYDAVFRARLRAIEKEHAGLLKKV